MKNKEKFQVTIALAILVCMAMWGVILTILITLAIIGVVAILGVAGYAKYTKEAKKKASRKHNKPSWKKKF